MCRTLTVCVVLLPYVSLTQFGECDEARIIVVYTASDLDSGVCEDDGIRVTAFSFTRNTASIRPIQLLSAQLRSVRS